MNYRFTACNGLLLVLLIGLIVTGVTVPMKSVATPGPHNGTKLRVGVAAPNESFLAALERVNAGLEAHPSLRGVTIETVKHLDIFPTNLLVIDNMLRDLPDAPDVLVLPDGFTAAWLYRVKAILPLDEAISRHAALQEALDSVYPGGSCGHDVAGNHHRRAVINAASVGTL